MISIIVAVAENNVIGKNNALLWHISDDLKYFKKITENHSIIMGRKTYFSLPFRPLKNRHNIVISNNLPKIEGAEVVKSIEEAFDICKNENEVFVIGGGAIYKQTIDFADKIYLTRVYANFEGDTFFPEIDEKNWKMTEQSEIFTDEKSGLKYQFFVIERKYLFNKSKMTVAIQKFISENNYPTFDLKAVFFDMDGVLFDSMPLHAKAWQQAMTEVGLDFSLYDAYMNEGRTGDSTIDEAFLLKYGKTADEETKRKIYQRKSDLFNEYNTTPQQIPNVYELLKIVKNRDLQIFVVTGSAQISLLDMLDRSFPNIFEEGKTVTAFDCKIGKPDPEPYLIALEKAKIEKWQALVVENAPLGVRSAVSAGLFTIGVNTGILKPEELEKEGANIVLPNMKTLVELVAGGLS